MMSRTSKGAIQHFQGIDLGENGGADEEGRRCARNRHRLLTSMLDCQNSGEAIRQGFRIRMRPVAVRVVHQGEH